MTPAELAAELHVTEKTLGNWRYEKKGPAYISTGTAKGKVSYLRADVLKWLKVQRIPTAECA